MAGSRPKPGNFEFYDSSTDEDTETLTGKKRKVPEPPSDASSGKEAMSASMLNRTNAGVNFHGLSIEIPDNRKLNRADSGEETPVQVDETSLDDSEEQTKSSSSQSATAPMRRVFTSYKPVRSSNDIVSDLAANTPVSPSSASSKNEDSATREPLSKRRRTTQPQHAGAQSLGLFTNIPAGSSLNSEDSTSQPMDETSSPVDEGTISSTSQSKTPATKTSSSSYKDKLRSSSNVPGGKKGGNGF